MSHAVIRGIAVGAVVALAVLAVVVVLVLRAQGQAQQRNDCLVQQAQQAIAGEATQPCPRP